MRLNRFIWKHFSRRMSGSSKYSRFESWSAYIAWKLKRRRVSKSKLFFIRSEFEKRWVSNIVYMQKEILGFGDGRVSTNTNENWISIFFSTSPSEHKIRGKQTSLSVLNSYFRSVYFFYAFCFVDKRQRMVTPWISHGFGSKARWADSCLPECSGP